MSKRYLINEQILILLKALIIAHNNKRYHKITQNTIVIVFIGTPHRGADLAKLLNTILKVSFSETRHVQDLSPNSQSIKEINDAFGERSEYLELASFWESTSMPLTGVRNDCRLTLTINRLSCLRFLQR